ncbi:hypothetical protein C8R45DRAFT_835841 [Mycena sanguinolenta]|nr:hypothetical protein C8R45DRAFT_835841 [Mycena sanguinolenta]
MLLIILLVYLSRDSSAAPVLHHLDARNSVNSGNDINNCRKLFDVIWGCFATVFACTWVSVHPNVPPPNQSSLALFWRRFKMMLIAILAPEIMVGFAARQFYGARMLSEGELSHPVSTASNARCAEFGFSMSHGFFFGMGGFVSAQGYPVATMKQLRDPLLGRQFQDAVRGVN